MAPYGEKPTIGRVMRVWGDHVALSSGFVVGVCRGAASGARRLCRGAGRRGTRGGLIQQGVTTTVYDGRVLLAGRVDRPELKAEANRAASAVPGVRALYDEIEVAPAEGVWDGAKDTWIAARVRSEMILDPDIRSGNYTIDTENGSVYLIGSARSQYELDRATRIARFVPGVRRVVAYVEIRSGAPVTARPAGPGPVPLVPHSSRYLPSCENFTTRALA